MGNSIRKEIKRRIRDIDPYQFEQLVGEIWELYDYNTTTRKGSGDRGIDIEASKDTPYDQLDLIQAKRYSENNTIGSDQVRNYSTLYNQKPEADIVVIVTTGYFTAEAERLANDLNVKIIDGDKLVEIIEKNRSYLTNLPKHHSSKKDSNSTNKESDSTRNYDPVEVGKGDTVWTISDQNKAEVIKVREGSGDYVLLVHKEDSKTKRTVQKDEVVKSKDDL